MMSLTKNLQNSDLCKTKQNIYHLKGIDKSHPKMYFLLNLSHCVKSYGMGIFVKFGFFYDARKPNMVMSRDARYRFRKFVILSLFNT